MTHKSGEFLFSTATQARKFGNKNKSQLYDIYQRKFGTNKTKKWVVVLE